MSDASEAFASPVVLSLGGEDVSFARLNLRDYGVIESAVREKMVAVDRELLNEAEVTGKERFNALRESANHRVTVGEVFVALETEEFARKTLRLSLKKSGITDVKAADALIDRLDGHEAGQLAKLLTGLLRPLPEPAKSSGSGSPEKSDATTQEPTPAS